MQVLSSGRRDYETYVANTHEKFRSFRDITIDKWSKKTKIASGKITSKVRLSADSPLYYVMWCDMSILSYRPLYTLNIQLCHRLNM